MNDFVCWIIIEPRQIIVLCKGVKDIKEFFDKIRSFFSDLTSGKKAPGTKKSKIRQWFENYTCDGEKVDWKKAGAQSCSAALNGVLRGFSYLFNILATVLLVCAITGVIVGIVFILYLKTNIDPRLDVGTLKTEQDATSRFFYFDDDGNAVELEDERIHGSENRIWASSAEIPQYVKDAFVAIEDHRFWDHKGVDWYRTAGAVTNFFLPSDTTFGGSTITQQLIKNVTQEDQVTIQRKVQEIFRALYVEKQLSKDEILELYLNTIYLSQGCSGVKTAAYTYFGKDVTELTLVEAAALASITKYPTKFDPVQHPDNNLERRNTVLKTMLMYGFISQAEYDEAFDMPLELNLQTEQTNNSTKVSSYYIDAVIEDIIADLMEQKEVTREIASNMLYSGGLDIYIAMDPKVQKIMEDCYLDENTFPTDNYIIKPQSSMVVCDPETGDILGIVGGRGKKTLTRGLNYATQTLRSPGSSIKPLAVYSPALELGLINYGTVIDDIPVEIVDGVDWPKNNSRTYQGLKNVAYAVSYSLNTTSMRVLRMVGVERSYEFTQKLGLVSLVESYTTSSGTVLSDKTDAAMALGATTLGVTVREMASAYVTFLNGGVHNKSRTYYEVVNQQKEQVLENKPEATVVFSEGTCSVMIKLMENVAKRQKISLCKYMDCAGKTGTSMYEYDKWFCGFTPYYSAAVWYGFEQPKPLPTFKTFAPVYIFDNVMTKLHEDIIKELDDGTRTAKKFNTENLVTAKICESSGMLYDPDTCGKDPRGGQDEIGYYVEGTQPKEKCTRHVLVNVCTDSGHVASSACPSVKKVALLLETERKFPCFIYVEDAQYIYRPLGNALPYNSSNGPFFQNTVPVGVFIGTTKKSGAPYNSYCTKHYSPNMKGDDPVEPPITEEPPQTDPAETGEVTDIPSTAPVETQAPEETAVVTENAPNEG